jgi:hypothetical protein
MRRIAGGIATAILLGLVAGVATSQASASGCGPKSHKRWLVKTLQDRPDLINAKPELTTIAKLRKLDAEIDNKVTNKKEKEKYSQLPRGPRVERTKYKVEKVFLKWISRKPDDGDVHLVIADPHNTKKTMVVEFPDPKCTGDARPDAQKQMADARMKLENACRMLPDTPPGIPVTGTATIVGVGFFDRPHAYGHSSNGIELHPVLGFTIDPESPCKPVTGGPLSAPQVGTGPATAASQVATSPSIASAGTVAFQANTSNLWTVGPGGRNDWRLGMMKGTSPSIAALKGGGYQVAFQANTGNLWTVGSAGDKDWGLGMRAATSPSIAATADGSFVVAFQANTSNLWTVGSGGKGDWGLGMMSGTSPSISPAGTVAFQANTSNLWTVGSGGKGDWRLGMMSGTSPSISPAGTVAFQANTSNLWTVGPGGKGDWRLGMM